MYPLCSTVIDATSKIPDGALQGNIMNFGNYEECLNVDVREDWGSFIGQHCLALYSLILSDLKINISLPEASFRECLLIISSICRVMPVLGMLVLFHSSNLHRFGSGPFFDFVAVKKGQEPCLKNWWSTLLFVQNYVNPLDRVSVA
ncbi:hypothetical protein C0J52_05790 [Blattella germanica]|nr:hypothetical protein C0J52_05790 [Blattella germanica]